MKRTSCRGQIKPPSCLTLTLRSQWHLKPLNMFAFHKSKVRVFVALSNIVRGSMFVLIYEGRTCLVFQMRVDWLRRIVKVSPYFCTFSEVTDGDGRKPVHTIAHNTSHTALHTCLTNVNSLPVWPLYCSILYQEFAWGGVLLFEAGFISWNNVTLNAPK